MLAIEAPKGRRQTQDMGISGGKGRFGSIARGPLGQVGGRCWQERFKMEGSPHGAKMGPEEASTQAKILAGPWLKIEENHAPHGAKMGPAYGAKMGPEGGSTQVNATEALLLPGLGLKIEGDHAPTWRQDGPRRGGQPRSMQLRLCCSRGLG